MTNRKGTKKEKDQIVFDTRTKAVMAQPQQEGVREKVQAVREVVPGRSNNEIILVLQYYDFNVEPTIQAYLEDGAKSALEEWKFGSVTKTKGKSRKKKNKQKSTQDETPSTDNAAVAVNDSHIEIQDLETNDEDNDNIQHERIDRSSPTTHVVSSETPPETKATDNHSRSNSPFKKTEPNSKCDISKTPASDENEQASPKQQHRKSESRSDKHKVASKEVNKNREHTTSESSTSTITNRNKGRYGGLEKSVKDLHRQTVSLQRLRLVFSDEVDRTYKRMKSVLDLLRKEFDERELHLQNEVTKVKLAGNSVLNSRQEKAVELKHKTERAQTMNDAQFAELKVELKSFVSDRKIDEELAHATRFFYDSDQLLELIKNFGSVVPVQPGYSKHRPQSASSSTVDSALSSSMQKSIASVSTSMSTSEIADLHQRLNKSLQLQGLPIKEKSHSQSPGPKSSYNRSPSSGRPYNNKSPSRAQNPRSPNRPQSSGQLPRSPNRPQSSGQRGVPQQQSNYQKRPGDQRSGVKDSKEHGDKTPEKRNRNAQRRDRFRERRQRESQDNLSPSTPVVSAVPSESSNNSDQIKSRKEVNVSLSNEEKDQKSSQTSGKQATKNVQLNGSPKPQRNERKPREDHRSKTTAQSVPVVANGVISNHANPDDKVLLTKPVTKNGPTHTAKDAESKNEAPRMTNGNVLMNGVTNHINGFGK